MNKFVITLLSMLAISVTAGDITGAGATFPYPIYSKWAEAYKKESNIGLNYQSIGSSGGIRQIDAKTVTFGATDAPVAGDKLAANGQVQFPAIIGGTVAIVNLEGFKPGELRITGAVLAEVYLGDITKWNDPRLTALNPVKWPAASSVGGKGNEGVAANVQRVKGAIGYVEYAYVKKNNLVFLQLQNRNGKYVSPDDLTFAAAAAGADWFSVPGMGISIVDQKGDATWPISTASFIIMYKEPSDKAASQDVLKFFDWAFRNGRKMAEELDYVALPDSVTAKIRSQVWSQIK